MAMPAPATTTRAGPSTLAGGALMDLGCYGLHVMRSLGRLAHAGHRGPPSIVGRARRAAHARRGRPVRRRARIPGGATGLSTHSMVGDDHSFTIRIVGTAGELLVHDFIKPSEDDRLTVTTAAGSTGRAPRHQRRRTPISWRRSPPTSSTAPRCRSATSRRGGEHGLRRCGLPRRGNGAPLAPSPREAPGPPGSARHPRPGGGPLVPPQSQQHHLAVCAEGDCQRVTPHRGTCRWFAMDVHTSIVPVADTSGTVARATERRRVV